jgi:hypothetical protein
MVPTVTGVLFGRTVPVAQTETLIAFLAIAQRYFGEETRIYISCSPILS